MCRLQLKWKAWGRAPPWGGPQNTFDGGVSKADSGFTHPLSRAAYPPPRESCVRGADRATMGKAAKES